MAYIALINFIDLQDNNRRYHAGDAFPRDGAAVSDERIAELAGTHNSLKKPVIAAAADEAPVKGTDAKAETVPEEAPKVDEKPVEKKRGRKKTVQE